MKMPCLARHASGTGLIGLVALAVCACSDPGVREAGNGTGAGAASGSGASGGRGPKTGGAGGTGVGMLPPVGTGSGGGGGAATGGEDCGIVQAVVRDFRTDHPDFENDALNKGLVKGIVNSDLGPDRKPVYAAAGPTAVTSGPEGFAQWYRDVPGTNIRFEIPLELTEERPGAFVYDNQKFFPLDGMGFSPADDRLNHNFGFTTEIHTTFLYRGNENFTFIGDDDVFAFVNGKLAIDLGGVHGARRETIDFAARAVELGLEVGKTYPLDVFHAERHTGASTFRIETSIACLKSEIIP